MYVPFSPRFSKLQKFSSPFVCTFSRTYSMACQLLYARIHRKFLIRLQRIRVKRGIGLNMLAYQRLQFRLAARLRHSGANLSATLKNGCYNGLSFWASPMNSTRTDILMHIARLASN